MNLLLMANAYKIAPYGIPRNGLVSIIDPWRDTYGRNIATISLSGGALTGTNPFYETVENSAHYISLLGAVVIGNTYYCSVDFTRIGGRKRFLFGNGGGLAWAIIDTDTVTIINKGSEVVSATITNIGTDKYRLVCKINIGTITAQFYFCSMPDLATDTSTRSFVGDITKGFQINLYQVNLGQLYPYAPPSGLPQSTLDYSGHGNTFQLGSTAGADTNDPAWSGNGLTFGTDDYCKSSSPAFDDMQAFTCITVFKANSAGGSSAGRLFDKNKRFMAYHSTRLQFFQYYDVGYEGYRGNIPTVFNQNVITCCMYDGTVPNLFLNTTKNIVEIFEGSASGNIQSDTTYDLFVGNRAGADRNFDGTIYLQLWYNRVLSDAEYMQAYNGLRRLMNSRGVVI